MSIKVDLETIFLDVIGPVREYISDSDHLEMLELVIQGLSDDGYDLKELYGNDDVLDEALNHVYGDLDDEHEDELFD